MTRAEADGVEVCEFVGGPLCGSRKRLHPVALDPVRVRHLGDVVTYRPDGKIKGTRFTRLRHAPAETSPA